LLAVSLTDQIGAGARQNGVLELGAGARFRPAGPAVGGAPVGGRPAAPDALAGERLVHQAKQWRFAVEEADERTPERAAHDEGLGAVNGIDHPAEPTRAVALAAAMLLTDDGMRGVMPLE